MVIVNGVARNFLKIPRIVCIIKQLPICSLKRYGKRKIGVDLTSIIQNLASKPYNKRCRAVRTISPRMMDSNGS